MTERRKVQLYNNVALFPKKQYSGNTKQHLLVSEGSRLVFTLYVFSKDPSATINLNVATSFSEQMPFCSVLDLPGSEGLHTKRILTDFHGFVDVELQVTGGNAEVIAGLTCFDNALSTRVDIDNAEISVDLNHIQQANGQYDSTRVGDGQRELQIYADRSAMVLDFINVNAPTALIDITSTPKKLNVEDDGDNLDNRKGMIIQPQNGTIFIGSADDSMPFRLARRSFTILKFGPNIDVWGKKNGGATHKVAIWELS